MRALTVDEGGICCLIQRYCAVMAGVIGKAPASNYWAAANCRYGRLLRQDITIARPSFLPLINPSPLLPAFALYPSPLASLPSPFLSLPSLFLISLPKLTSCFLPSLMPSHPSVPLPTHFLPCLNHFPSLLHSPHSPFLLFAFTSSFPAFNPSLSPPPSHLFTSPLPSLIPTHAPPPC